MTELIGRASTGGGRPEAFPWARADLARSGVERDAPERHLGVDYDTDWSRRYPARLARAVLLDNVTRPLAHVVASPEVRGDEMLELVEAAGHLRRQPRQPRRHRRSCCRCCPPRSGTRRWWPPPPTTSSTGAGRPTCGPSSSAAIPIERHRVNRRSAETRPPRCWTRVEPGHLPRGRPLPRRVVPGHSAAAPPTWPPRTGRPVVPVHIDGTYRILPRGGERLRRSPTRITFGSPIVADRGRGRPRASRRGSTPCSPPWPTRRRTDWWTARRRAGAGTTPSPRGPDGRRRGGGRGRSDPTPTTATTDDDGRWALVERLTRAAVGSRRTDGVAHDPAHVDQPSLRRRTAVHRPGRRRAARPTPSRRSPRSARSSTSSRGAGTEPVAQARSRSARLGLRARTGPCA